MWILRIDYNNYVIESRVNSEKHVSEDSYPTIESCYSRSGFHSKVYFCIEIGETVSLPTSARHLSSLNYYSHSQYQATCPSSHRRRRRRRRIAVPPDRLPSSATPSRLTIAAVLPNLALLSCSLPPQVPHSFSLPIPLLGYLLRIRKGCSHLMLSQRWKLKCSRACFFNLFCHLDCLLKVHLVFHLFN